MSKALAINPDIGLREILDISNGNDYDVVYSPLLRGPGGSQGGTFVKPAPIHEGASTDFSNPDALPGDVTVAPLKQFQGELESFAPNDDSGMCVVSLNGGGYQLVPYRSGLAMELAGSGEVVDGTEGIGLESAQQRYVQLSGRPMEMPTVF